MILLESITKGEKIIINIINKIDIVEELIFLLISVVYLNPPKIIP